MQQGDYRYWYESGQLWMEGQFENGQKQGQWTYWKTDGQKQKVVTYQDGQIITEQERSPAFELIDVTDNHQCGSYKNKIIKIEYKHLISGSYTDIKYAKDGTCTVQMHKIFWIIIGKIWSKYGEVMGLDLQKINCNLH